MIGDLLDALVEGRSLVLHKCVLKSAVLLLFWNGRDNYTWVIGGKHFIQPEKIGIALQN